MAGLLLKDASSAVADEAFRAGCLEPRPLRLRRGGHLASGLSRQSALRLLDDRLESFRLADRELGQHLAIDFNAGLGEPVDEARIGEAELAHGGVQPLNP